MYIELVTTMKVLHSRKIRAECNLECVYHRSHVLMTVPWDLRFRLYDHLWFELSLANSYPAQSLSDPKIRLAYRTNLHCTVRGKNAEVILK
jgi:hypothetical protein